MRARVITSLALPAALATAGLLNTAEAAYAALGPDTPTASAKQEQPIGDVTFIPGTDRPCPPIGNVTITDYGHCCTPVGNMTVTDYGRCCTPVGNMTVTDYGHSAPVGNVTICDYGHHRHERPHHKNEHRYEHRSWQYQG
ncbi:hypothetical protein GCM10020367_64410 [Streptomyces sannanensis]|uniref:Secreted protein n=1 Tax=Streptomyces sannanensis TaxID=285536 RepID=A0ABP6SM32_9ACTN